MIRPYIDRPSRCSGYEDMGASKSTMTNSGHWVRRIIQGESLSDPDCTLFFIHILIWLNLGSASVKGFNVLKFLTGNDSRSFLGVYHEGVLALPSRPVARADLGNPFTPRRNRGSGERPGGF